MDGWMDGDGDREVWGGRWEENDEDAGGPGRREFV